MSFDSSGHITEASRTCQVPLWFSELTTSGQGGARIWSDSQQLPRPVVPSLQQAGKAHACVAGGFAKSECQYAFAGRKPQVRPRTSLTCNAVQVFCFYEGTRDVNPGYKKSLISTRPFGVHLDVAGIMAKQVRIERQDSAHVAAVSFDRYAVHAFQQYVQSAHAFSIKRCGILYGRLGEDKVVYVDAVYEPDQTGQSETMTFNLRNSQVRTSTVCGVRSI